MLSIATLMSTLDGGMVSAAFPALVDAFDTDTSTVLWVQAAFWVTSVGLLLTMGWLGDVVGRRRVFILGYLVFTLGMVLSAASTEIWHLIVARVVQGIGSAMTLSNLNALITASFPRGERGKAIGMSGAVVGVGLSSGPLLGGLLLDVLDWRAVFYSRAPLGLLGAGLAWWLLATDRNVGGRFQVDFLGAGALFVTLGAALLVVNRGGELGFGSAPVIGLGITAVVALPILVRTQLRSARPIIDVALFKSRQYTIVLLVLCCHYLAHGPFILVAPFFLIDSLGFSATKMGLFLAAFYVGRTFLAPPAGAMSDRFGPRPFLVLGNGVLVLSLLWLGVQATEASEWVLLAGLLAAGMGSGLFEPVATSAIMGSAPEDRLGTASASVAMGRHVAFSVGVAVAGAIFVIRQRVYLAAAGSETAVDPVAGAFGDTVLAGMAMAVLALIFSLLTRRPGY